MLADKADIVDKDPQADGSCRYRVLVLCDNDKTIAYDVTLTPAEVTAASTDALVASTLTTKLSPWLNGKSVTTPGTGIAPATAALPTDGAEPATLETPLDNQPL